MLSLLNNLSVRSKVTLSFAIVCAIVIGLGLFAWQRMSLVNADAAAVRDDALPSGMMLGRAAQLSERYRAATGTLLLARTDADRAQAEASMAKTRQDMKEVRAAYAPLVDA